MLTDSMRRLMIASCRWVGGAALILAAAATYFYVRHGSARALFVLASGAKLMAIPATIDLGDLEHGERRQAVVAIKNLGDGNAAVIGCHTNCTCLSAQGVPVTIPAGEQREVKLLIKGAGRKSTFDQWVTIYTDDQDSGELLVRVVGRLKPDEETDPDGVEVLERRPPAESRHRE